MNLYLPWRIRPPTGSQLTVFFWAIFVILVGFGAVCLFLGYRAPPEKAHEAARVIRWGYGFIAVGVAIYVVRKLFCGFSS